MMLSDLIFKIPNIVSEEEFTILDSLGCLYHESENYGRIFITSNEDTEKHIEDINSFIENISPETETILHKLEDKRIMITATVPYQDKMTRRILLDKTFMAHMINMNLSFDYEVAPCSEPD